ncbi:hypothetical protein PFDG_02299 [Plasmodium falciparum Dd2]|uniref:Uncharacterized protein n=1 Tax=Plasmodium falciparum (isolate Dd2) TaxID=57267 RepID=A0A0L7M0S2_PLAF4|nr:hypothetical protein PFDG_02299 [Plasmodium falciparum Dd2]
MRNPHFLDIIKELIYYKMILEMYKMREKRADYNKELIYDEHILKNTLKYSSNNNGDNININININNLCNFNYYHNGDILEHELNYLNKMNDVIYFFIPFNVTDFLLKKNN